MITDYSKGLYSFLKDVTKTYEQPINMSAKKSDNEYITYAAQVGSFSESTVQTIYIFTKSTTYKRIKEIAEEIEQKIKECGIIIREDWGHIYITKGSPYYQNMETEDEEYRGAQVNLNIKIYQKEM